MGLGSFARVVGGGVVWFARNVGVSLDRLATLFVFVVAFCFARAVGGFLVCMFSPGLWAVWPCWWFCCVGCCLALHL